MRSIKLFFSCLFLFLASFCASGQQWKQYMAAANSAEKNNTDTALYYYLKARELVREETKGSMVELDLDKRIARGYLANQEYSKLDTILADIKKIVVKNSTFFDSTYAVWVQDSIGVQLFTAYEYLRAKVCFSQSKQIRESLSKENADYARSCHLLGTVYNVLGQYEEALPLLKASLSIRERLFTKESNQFAQSCNSLADLYRNVGNYEQAEYFAIQAKEIRGRIADKLRINYAISCTALANVYRDFGQYKKAEPLYLEAKAIRQKLMDSLPLPYAESCNILADLYYYQLKYKQAEELYLEAKQIREKVKGKHSYPYAQSCNNLASLYRDQNEFDKAESLALEAKEIYEIVLPKSSPTLPISYNNLADLYFDKGDYNQAENYYNQARKLWKESVGEGHRYFTGTTQALARIYWNRKDWAKSRQLYQNAYKSKRIEVKKVFEFTNENQKQNYLANINGTSDEFHSFYFLNQTITQGADIYQMSLENKNLILSSSQRLRNIINSQHDSALNKVYNLWRESKERLAFLYTQPTNDKEEINILENRSDNYEKDLTQASALFNKEYSKNNITWQQLQKRLKPGSAAIEFVEFNLFNGKRWTDSVYYVAVLLRNELAQPLVVSLFEKRKLDTLLKNSSTAVYNLYLRGGEVTNTTAISRNLYDLVWKPIEKHLKGINNIYFSPAGLLHRVSFAALPINARQALSDKYFLHQLSSTASLIENKNDVIASSDQLYAYGGIFYDVDSASLPKELMKNSTTMRALLTENEGSQKWTFLPGTEKEVNLIKKLAEQKKYNVILRTGAAANEESVKALTDIHFSSILHFATHGFFFPDPEDISTEDFEQVKFNGNAFRFAKDPLFRSGVLLAGANYTWQGKPMRNREDGILTAYEVSNLYLPNTKLVVLSGCETALGEIQGSEGVYGLQRAFQLAGVKNLIMSLWKVPDMETAEFMQLFYSYLFSKLSIEESFRKTQMFMKNKYRKEPYKWGAWVLIQ